MLEKFITEYFIKPLHSKVTKEGPSIFCQVEVTTVRLINNQVAWRIGFAQDSYIACYIFPVTFNPIKLFEIISDIKGLIRLYGWGLNEANEENINSLEDLLAKAWTNRSLKFFEGKTKKARANNLIKNFKE